MAPNDYIGPGKAFRDQAEVDAARAEFDRARDFEDDDEENDPNDPDKIFLRPAPRSPGALRRNLALSEEERGQQLQAPPIPPPAITQTAWKYESDPRPTLSNDQLAAAWDIAGKLASEKEALAKKRSADNQRTTPIFEVPRPMVTSGAGPSTQASPPQISSGKARIQRQLGNARWTVPAHVPAKPRSIITSAPRPTIQVSPTRGGETQQDDTHSQINYPSWSSSADYRGSPLRKYASQSL